MHIERIKKIIPLILAGAFILFVIFYEPNIQNLNIDKSANISNIIESRPSNDWGVDFLDKAKNDCMGIDVYLDGAKEKLENNETALNILQDNCLWLLNYNNDDFDGDQKNEIAMITGGAGCGSCHWNVIFIIKNNRVIFEKEAEDINIWAVKDIGFAIKYPIRKEGEPMCCPTEGIVEVYKANNTSESFVKVEEHIEVYPIR